MNPATHDAQVSPISPEALRAALHASREGEYLVVDVREPEEYATGHIPGAKLLPLSEIERRFDELIDAPQGKKVFVCRSGGRSTRAAQWFVQHVPSEHVLNLVGGMGAWNGDQLVGLPRLRALNLDSSVEALLRQAIDLEKGTDKLYRMLAGRFRDTPVGRVFQTMVDAEQEHAKTLYQLLRAAAKGNVEDFESLYEASPGQVLESGEDLHAALERAYASAQAGQSAILSWALEMEWNAYDLYANLAHKAPLAEMRATLQDLAAEEKLHARAIAQALARH